MQKLLVTGCAGFIGYHLCKRLLEDGQRVVGVDSMNDYYNLQLKQDRLRKLTGAGLQFVPLNLTDQAGLLALYGEHGFDRVIHLAAQAGVRYSLTNPHAYLESNLHGFLNVLEACRHYRTPHLVYASSSSVYGLNRTMPFSVGQGADHPVSLYAATKKANELMAHSYASMYGTPVTGLRFFTVYGPWGRPDMALYLFASAIMRGEPIRVYNHGHMSRDFTYVDDIVEGLVRIKDVIATPNPDWNPEAPDPSTSSAPARVYNIGSHRPVELAHLIELVEQNLGRTAHKELLPMQVGDVLATYADVQSFYEAVGPIPATEIEEGVRRSMAWYLDYRPSNSGV